MENAWWVKTCFCMTQWLFKESSWCIERHWVPHFTGFSQDCTACSLSRITEIHKYALLYYFLHHLYQSHIYTPLQKKHSFSKLFFPGDQVKVSDPMSRLKYFILSVNPDNFHIHMDSHRHYAMWFWLFPNMASGYTKKGTDFNTVTPFHIIERAFYRI